MVAIKQNDPLQSYKAEPVNLIRATERRLETAGDLDPLLDAIGDAHYVLLGEASHGTSEFYTWRARLSQRLISEKRFSFIAVEGDWPDCYWVNRYGKGYNDAGENAPTVLQTFDRWPNGCTVIIRAAHARSRLASMGWMSTACGSRWRASWAI